MVAECLGSEEKLKKVKMLMSDLKEKKIPKLLPAENICTYAIDWTERGKSLCTQIKYSFVMIVFRKKKYTFTAKNSISDILIVTRSNSLFITRNLKTQVLIP